MISSRKALAHGAASLVLFCAGIAPEAPLGLSLFSDAQAIVGAPLTAGTPAPKGERRLYVFPYVWRQDNVEQARGLEALIGAIRADYGDATLRVDIVAHSMGGLIARYYLRHGPRVASPECSRHPSRKRRSAMCCSAATAR